MNASRPSASTAGTLPTALVRRERLGSWSVDVPAGEVFLSDEACAIHGVPAGTRLSLQQAFGHSPPERREEMVRRYQACAEQGQPFDTELELVTAQGDRRWVRVTGEAVRDRAGRIIRVQGICQDISADERVDATPQWRHSGFRQLADALPQIVWVASADGLVRDLNRRFHVLVAPDAAQQPEDQWLAAIHPEDRGAWQRSRAAALTGEEAWQLELRLRLAGGALRWHQVSVQPLRAADGTLLRWIGLAIDIHGRTRAEAATRQLAERLNTTLESISDALFVLDEGLRFVFVNSEAERMLARPRRELLGRLVTDSFPAPAAGELSKMLTQARARQQTATLELYLPTRERWFSVRVYPSHEGLAVYLLDITSVRAAQERLRQNEIRFRAIARATADVIWDWNLKAGTLWWNEGVSRVFGWDRRVLERGLESWSRRIHPDDRSRVLAGIDEALAERVQTWEAQYRFQHAEGHYIEVEDRGYLILDPSGQPTRAVGAMRDVGARRHWERRLAEQARRLEANVKALQRLAAFRSSDDAELARFVAELAGSVVHGDGAVFATVDGDELVYAGVTGSMAGYVGQRLPQAGSLAGRALLEGRTMLCIDADTDPRVERSLASKMSLRSLVVSPLPGDQGPLGVVKIVAGSPNAFTEADGASLALFAESIAAVLRRKTLEQQLRESQRLEALGQLTGGVAHDFNNLLTVILGNGELLVEGLRGHGELQDLAELVLDAAQRGADLTHQLLAFGRRQPLAPRAVDVNRRLQEMDALLRRTLAETIEVKLQQADGLWLALVDPAELESALLNLCLNARDAMPGGGRLTIETANTVLAPHDRDELDDVDPGEYVRIRVSDTGCGIPARDLPRVFEPFFTTKQSGAGTGLGMSMVYGFVRQSGGQVKLQSEVGQGTTVELYLPRAEGPEEPVVRRVTGSLEAVPGHPAVLVVEDDPLVREHVEAQLAALGYRVTVAGDGPAALEILRSEMPVDLLFTDIVMPGGMNGRELADAARRLRPALGVLLTSGYTEDVAVDHGRLHAGVALLTKPYRTAELARGIRQALNEEQID